jgi:hypothetical protein
LASQDIELGHVNVQGPNATTKIKGFIKQKKAQISDFNPRQFVEEKKQEIQAFSLEEFMSDKRKEVSYCFCFHCDVMISASTVVIFIDSSFALLLENFW